jgi:hypothetical protein
MPSSKIDHETGIVTITTPGRTSSVGDRLFVWGSAATFGIGYADWVLRLVDPLPPWRGQTSGMPNHKLAEERLLEQLRSGEVHRSLVEVPVGSAPQEPVAHREAA